MSDGITLTIKLRLRDRHAAELARQARAVNFVWNYCNETSGIAWRRDHRWLSGFDLEQLTAGSSKMLDLHSHTIQQVCLRFARSRDKARRASIRWRGKKSLGWVPFSTGHVAFNGESLKFRGASYAPMHLNPHLVAGIKMELWQPDREEQLAAVEILLASPLPHEVRLHLRDFHADLTGGRR